MDSTNSNEKSENEPDRVEQAQNVTEQGRRLANERDDLIAAGVDPAELAAPVAPDGVPADTSDPLGTRALLAAEQHAAGDDLGTYVAMFDQYRADQKHWLGPAQLPLVFHIRKLCAKLDADPDAPASLSSAYLQALHRLERQRPGSRQPAGSEGDLPGQGSIFDEL